MTNNQPWFMNSRESSQSGSIANGDLTVVQDEMYQEALAYKKCKVYENRFQDPSLKRMACDHAEHHRQHFDALNNYLGTRQ